MHRSEEPDLVAGRSNDADALALWHAVERAPGVLWTTDADDRITAVLGTDAVIFGLDPERAVGRALHDLLPADHGGRTLAAASARSRRGESIQHRHRVADRLFDVQITPLRDQRGMVTGSVALAVDITERERTEANLAGQRQILEMLAAGGSLEQVLSQLCLHLETMIPGTRCSILLLDDDGHRLRHGAAPSLPPSWAAATQSVEIGPVAGSCGTAAYRREAVITEEIATDPLWVDFRDLALAHGLQAAWSVLIRDSDQDAILGTFAIYYAQPQRPHADDLMIVEEAVHLASVTIRGKRAEAALVQSEQRLRDLASAAERQATELSLLHQVRSALAREVDLPSLFRTVVHAVAEAFGYTQVSLYLLKDDVLILQHHVGYDRVIERVPITTGVAGRVVRSGKPALIIDGPADPDFLAAIEGLGSEVCVPLHDRGAVAGVLILETRRGVALGDDDLQLMIALGEHVDVAIARARLDAEVRTSEARFSTFMDNTPAIAWMKDESLRFAYINRTYERRFNISSDQILRRTDDAIWPTEAAAVQANDRVVLETNETIEVVETASTPDGRARQWLTLKFPFHDPSGQRFVGGVAIDITERSETEDRLRASEELLAEAQRLVHLGSWEIDLATRGVTWSPESYRIFGLPIGSPLTQDLFIERIHPDDREILFEAASAVLSADEGYDAEYRIFRPDGEERVVATRGVVVRDDDGQPVRLRGTNHDVTEQRRSEAALRESEARYRNVVETQTELICRYPPDATLTFVNDAYCRFFGRSRSDLVGSRFLSLLPEADREAAQGRIALLMAQPHRVTHEHEVMRPDGSVSWQQWTDQPILDADGRLIEIQGTGRDLTERRTLELRLEHQAYWDPLTDLPNRPLFLERLDAALGATPNGSNESVAVLFLDLDGFKLVNDGLGHLAGDEILVAVGRRLASAVPEPGLLARLGGDEFAILFDRVTGPEVAIAQAEALLDALRAAFVVSGREVFITASIGIATRPPRRVRPDDLLRDADIALYQAKGSGRGTYALFEGRMRATVIAKLERETALRGALAREEFRLLYQPMVDLATGRVLGVEALLRWAHPEQGLLLPADFIALAEETRLIVPLGSWVVREACRQGQCWIEQLGDDAPRVIAVNLSAHQLQRPDIVAEIAAILHETGLAPRRLELEITESVAMADAPETRRALRALRRLGVRLAIDDFGTGYSSLSYLRHLPLDTLKVDGSFVTAMGRDGGSLAIIRAVTTLAHDLGLQVTAEWVESAEQRARLVDLGIDHAQGFFFAPALDAAQVSELLTHAASLPIHHDTAVQVERP